MATSNEVQVDPRWYVPENIVDVRRSNSYDEYDYTNYVDTPFAPDPFTPGGTLSTPIVTIQVVSQIVRTAPDGTNVVDVILELPDQQAGINYITRHTKIDES